MSITQASDPIKGRIEAIKEQNNVYGVGRVARMKGYIVEVSGMENVGYFERVSIADKAEGYVSRIGRGAVTIELVKQNAPLFVGDEVSASGEVFGAYFSMDSIGKVVDMFAEDKMTGNIFKDREPIGAIPAPIPIMDRTKVHRPLYTGLSSIDMMYPIGRGQRQLIIGDKKTGKTQIGLDAIVNQRGQNTICIYVALGKSKKTVKEVYADLLARGAMEYTIILAAFQDDGAPALYMTPNVALSIANIYMRAGGDVLVVLDDLTTHANIYREISLLAGKVPGRDAYPADIFYLHASLLEQGCQHKDGGSITILPIVETRGGEITDYVSTNIISITDGQIVLSAKAFEKGQKPALIFGLSVSRLGGAVQTDEMKKLGAAVRQELLAYLETREVFELVNLDEMNDEMRRKLARGNTIMSRINQYKFSPLTPDEMLSRFSNLDGED
ncbi:MAG: F0F1 ATP synthase subunit alpha [Clostridiales Family XIII bacterium]|jgi:F-type H+-transporting ATPase subunit alpha|nr:F0F1 ATP synthase subunit alpha [Clostridiales Family XIII bacterium]